MAYKVISLKRYSSNTILYERYNTIKIEDLLIINPQYEAIYKKYEKDKWVHSDKDSAGIFCFRKRIDAESFIIQCAYGNDSMIVKVQGKGRKHEEKLKNIVSNPAILFSLFKGPYSVGFGVYLCDAPHGTVFYEKVKVLE